jgi:hypothetical protein
MVPAAFMVAKTLRYRSEGLMRLLYVLFILLTIVWGAVAAPPPKVTTLTGVVTQKGETFSLIEPDTMKPIAELKGVGFNTEHFANFIGQKVSVRGTLVTAGGRKILEVRSVGDIQKAEEK